MLSRKRYLQGRIVSVKCSLNTRGWTFGLGHPCVSQDEDVMIIIIRREGERLALHWDEGAEKWAQLDIVT